MRKGDCGARAVVESDASQTTASRQNHLTGRMPAAQWLSSPRLRLQLYHRRLRAERRRHIPCWLASFVLHLLAVVVLGSLAVPVSQHRRFGDLLFSFASAEANRDSSPQPAVLLASEALDELALAEAPAFMPAPIAGPVAADLAGQNQPPDQPVRAADENSRSAAVKAAQANIVSYALGNLPDPEPPPVKEQETALSTAERTKQDGIVDRFIAFDIGKLRGESGVRAKRDFDRLGPAAIPSLVYGLNRAARIHASCPVVVITAKLDQALNENRDPAMLRYALDHLGEGVPSNAPHFARLQTFIAKWSGAKPNTLRPTAVQTLFQLLESRRFETRLQAAASLIEDPDVLSAADKPEAAWILIRWLTSKNARLRDAAHRALVALAEGADLGPSGKADSGERQAAACRWSMHFDAERLEAAARDALQTARHLDENGRRDGALRSYRKVTREYEGTEAAAEAAEALRRIDAVVDRGPWTVDRGP